MRTVLFLLAFLCLAPVCTAQIGEAATRSMFGDVRAMRNGDVVTILIVEDVQADNTARTGNSSSTNLSAGVSGSVNNNQGSVNGSISTGNAFSGQGQSARSESVKARLTARIVDAENTSAMRVEGKRTVTINGETQIITLSGLVRYIDIQTDNTVYSYNVADLTLSYNGDGPITKAQQPGLFTKFLRFLF
ncbi:MAG: flagellar basal body L-ring protein FlgH [Candidatus Kapaibacterium sp.]